MGDVCALAENASSRLFDGIPAATARARPGRLSALSVLHSKSIFYGAFVWVRRALNI
jgi:hypothetical protein